MQKLVASRLNKEKKIGNWSGTGAGKTLGAVLASRTINANLTVIVALNNTILDPETGWQAEITNSFPLSNVIVKKKNFDLNYIPRTWEQGVDFNCCIIEPFFGGKYKFFIIII